MKGSPYRPCVHPPNPDCDSGPSLTRALVSHFSTTAAGSLAPNRKHTYVGRHCTIGGWSCGEQVEERRGRGEGLNVRATPFCLLDYQCGCKGQHQSYNLGWLKTHLLVTAVATPVCGHSLTRYIYHAKLIRTNHAYCQAGEPENPKGLSECGGD